MPLMNRIIRPTMLGFLGLFVVGVAVVGIHQVYSVIPAKRCEAGGGWWEPKSRVCATPLYLPNITGRAPGVTAAQAAADAMPEAEAKSPKSKFDPRPDF